MLARRDRSGIWSGASRGAAAARRAFSLLELMLVLVIIGALASVAAWNLIGQGERAKAKATEASMHTIASALSSYFLEHNAYPPTIAVLGQTHLDPKKLKDGWKRDFQYQVGGPTGEPFILISLGADGKYGTGDDINFNTLNGQN